MTAYYNEIDPYAAQWLRNLISAGHIAKGDVDERSICDVKPDDLRGYTQCHFFAGIGVWSYALRLAGWPDDRRVWTGSCPCQPFSAAGKGKGTADERHLWPVWFNLIREFRPDTVFGEQVEAAVRHGWLDLVQADLEGVGYACGAASIPAAGVGAPHIRQRLWFVADSAKGSVADSANNGHSATNGLRAPTESSESAGEESVRESARSGDAGLLAHAQDFGQQRQLLRAAGGLPQDGTAQGGGIGGVADAVGERLDERQQPRRGVADENAQLVPVLADGVDVGPVRADDHRDWEPQYRAAAGAVDD